LKVLQQETKKAQELAHPNIVNVYDFDRDGDTIYMTMECLEGETLDEVIKRVPPHGIPFDKALPYIDGMVQALAYAHKRGIVHSDFKPGNVFCTTDSVVKVLDFGIARALHYKDGRDTAVFDPGVLGALTPAYASCEMFENQEPDPRDDIYALACITYELLTGRHPFNRTPAVEARDKDMKPVRIRTLKRRQWAALAGGLALNREDRTAEVLNFLAGLKPRPLVRGQTLVLGLLLVALFGYYAYEQTRITPEKYLPPPVILTAAQKAKIAELKEAAEIYLAAEYLAAPPGDNAYEIYKQILEIDPRDKTARENIRKIADKYFTLVESAMKSGETDRAKTYIELGLTVNPSHKGLLALGKKLQITPTTR
jgi:serine/threonine protein kinase